MIRRRITMQVGHNAAGEWLWHETGECRLVSVLRTSTRKIEYLVWDREIPGRRQLAESVQSYGIWRRLISQKMIRHCEGRCSCNCVLSLLDPRTILSTPGYAAERPLSLSWWRGLERCLLAPWNLEGFCLGDLKTLITCSNSTSSLMSFVSCDEIRSLMLIHLTAFDLAFLCLGDEDENRHW